MEGKWSGVMVILLLIALSASPALAETRFVFANESPYDAMDPHAAFDVGRVAVRVNLYTTAFTAGSTTRLCSSPGWPRATP